MARTRIAKGDRTTSADKRAIADSKKKRDKRKSSGGRNDALKEELLALGGNEEDYDLIKDVDGEHAIMGDEKDDVSPNCCDSLTVSLTAGFMCRRCFRGTSLNSS